MCGLSGVVSQGGGDFSNVLRKMVDVQGHRGPDGAGVWRERIGRYAVHLGHGRLAIQDPSSAAKQPFVSANGRQILVFNGEVYNFVELRADLERRGVIFTSRSDTEVVFHSLRLDGDAAIPRFNGMWALAWVDMDRQQLLLSRDRMGQKPLYYHRDGASLIFASEIKGILKGAGKRFDPNLPVVAKHLRQSLLDAQDETFFTGILSLPAGHNMLLDLSEPGLPFEHRRYWTIPVDKMWTGGIDELAAAMRETLIDSVRIQLRSDVPVGVLLSGGLGSSSIAAAMRHILGKGVPIQAFSAISDEPAFNEERHVDTISTFLDCTTHKLNWRPSGDEAFRLLEEMTWFNDEPLGDFSSIYHHLLMRAARDRGITVMLSGNGDDEIFCGYKKYLGFHLQTLLRQGRLPTAARVAMEFWQRGTVFRQLNWSEASRYVPGLGGNAASTLGPRLRDFRPEKLGLGRATLVQRQCDDILRLSMPTQLHYEDRMSMACSREVRLPFLDHRLVEMAVPLATDLKLRDGWQKWVWRRAMQDMLPEAIAWRRDKLGFANPQSLWLKRELAGSMRSLLSGDLLTERYGLVDRRALISLYDRYVQQPDGQGRISYRDVLNPVALELWLRVFEGHLTPP